MMDQEATRAVSAQVRKWSRERWRVALRVECAPLESSFSEELQHLLAQEERLTALGPEAVSSESHALCGKIEEMIENETRRYFETQCRHGLESWRAVFARQEREQRSIEIELEGKVARLPPAGEVEPALEKERRFQAEEDRLRRRAHEDWAETQGYDLDCAFGLQLARIDADWAAYENRLRSEPLENKKSKPRWHNKEKQSRLAHTAPVLEPKGSRGDDNLERAIERVAFQQTNAKKWIRRQAMRMHVQLRACRAVHSAVAALWRSHDDFNQRLVALARDFDARGKTRAEIEPATRGFLAADGKATPDVVQKRHDPIVPKTIIAFPSPGDPRLRPKTVASFSSSSLRHPLAVDYKVRRGDKQGAVPTPLASTARHRPPSSLPLPKSPCGGRR